MTTAAVAAAAVAAVAAAAVAVVAAVRWCGGAVRWWSDPPHLMKPTGMRSSKTIECHPARLSLACLTNSATSCRTKFAMVVLRVLPHFPPRCLALPCAASLFLALSATLRTHSPHGRIVHKCRRGGGGWGAVNPTLHPLLPSKRIAPSSKRFRVFSQTPRLVGLSACRQCDQEPTPR